MFARLVLCLFGYKRRSRAFNAVNVTVCATRVKRTRYEDGRNINMRPTEKKPTDSFFRAGVCEQKKKKNENHLKH